MRFIESILFKDGNYHNLALHQTRIDQVFSVFAPKNNFHRLQQILPDLNMDGTFKVRIVFDTDSEDAVYNLEYAEYHPRIIQTLDVVVSQPFDYSFKYEDRSKIDTLVRSSQADDIIITVENNITDGSYFNLAFWDGSEWLTPSTPLLKGTRRAKLLQEQKISEVLIRLSDLSSFEKVSLINAMMDLGVIEIPISAISIPKNDD